MVRKVINTIGYAAFVGLWIWVIGLYSVLPEKIPIHFNGLGEADRYGPKATIWWLMILMSAVFLGLVVIKRFPQHFNYPIEIDDSIKKKMQRLSIEMLSLIQLAVVLVFGVIVWEIVRYVESLPGLGVWSVPLVLSLIFVPVVIYLFRMFRIK